MAGKAAVTSRESIAGPDHRLPPGGDDRRRHQGQRGKFITPAYTQKGESKPEAIRPA